MRNFSLVAHYSLKLTHCSLLVVKSLVTRCKVCLLLVANVARCKKSLVTRCKTCSLVVAEDVRCKKSLITLITGAFDKIFFISLTQSQQLWIFYPIIYCWVKKWSASNTFQLSTLTWKNFKLFGSRKQMILKNFDLTLWTCDCFNE